MKSDISGNTLPSISAIITNHDSGSSIINCIRSLYDQNIQLESVIVINTGSSDNSAEVIREKFPLVRIIELDTDPGLAAARNIGLKEVSSELVLILDDDIYLKEECLPKLILAYLKSGSSIVCPRIVLYPDSEIVQCDGAEVHFLGTMMLRHEYTPVRNASENADYVGACIGACMLIDRDRITAAHGFDEMYFFYFEDLEFCIRMRAMGYMIFCEPSAVVYHDRGYGTPGLSFRGSGEYPKRRIYFTLRHRVLTLLIHYNIRTLIVLSPALMIYEISTLCFVMLKGWGREWLRAYFWILANSSRIMKRRKFMKKCRTISDKEILSGGMLPLAHGLIKGRTLFAVSALSKILYAYWKIAKRFTG